MSVNLETSDLIQLFSMQKPIGAYRTSRGETDIDKYKAKYKLGDSNLNQEQLNGNIPGVVGLPRKKKAVIEGNINVSHGRNWKEGPTRDRELLHSREIIQEYNCAYKDQEWEYSELKSSLLISNLYLNNNKSLKETAPEINNFRKFGLKILEKNVRWGSEFKVTDTDDIVKKILWLINNKREGGNYDPYQMNWVVGPAVDAARHRNQPLRDNGWHYPSFNCFFKTDDSEIPEREKIDMIKNNGLLPFGIFREAGYMAFYNSHADFLNFHKKGRNNSMVLNYFGDARHGVQKWCYGMIIENMRGTLNASRNHSPQAPFTGKDHGSNQPGITRLRNRNIFPGVNGEGCDYDWYKPGKNFASLRPLGMTGKKVEEDWKYKRSNPREKRYDRAEAGGISGSAGFCFFPYIQSLSLDGRSIHNPAPPYTPENADGLKKDAAALFLAGPGTMVFDGGHNIWEAMTGMLVNVIALKAIVNELANELFNISKDYSDEYDFDTLCLQLASGGKSEKSARGWMRIPGKASKCPVLCWLWDKYKSHLKKKDVPIENWDSKRQQDNFLSGPAPAKYNPEVWKKASLFKRIVLGYLNLKEFLNICDKMLIDLNPSSIDKGDKLNNGEKDIAIEDLGKLYNNDKVFQRFIKSNYFNSITDPDWDFRSEQYKNMKEIHQSLYARVYNSQVIYIALEGERWRYNGSRSRNMNKVIKDLLNILEIGNIDEIVNDQLLEHIEKGNCTEFPRDKKKKKEEIKKIPYV